MKYAEVAVNAPVGINRTLTYSIPPGFALTSGQMVWVPLGRRPVQGVVFEVTDQTQVETPLAVFSGIEPSPLISPVGLILARWMSEYYRSSLFEAVALMLPPGFKDRVATHFEVANFSPDFKYLTDVDSDVWHEIQKHERLSERDIRKAFGPRSEASISRLIDKKLLLRHWRIPRPRSLVRYDSRIFLSMVSRDATQVMESLARRSPRQAELLKLLLGSSRPMPLEYARKQFGSSTVNRLMDRDLVAREWVRRGDDPKPLSKKMIWEQISPTNEQAVAIERIYGALDRGLCPGSSDAAFLIHGVTGSGKTEVYLRALEHCIVLGRKGILLVPEIALTAQMVSHLNLRFPGRVALMHSGMSAVEQFQIWWKIQSGEYDVVVGPRSVLFCPLPDLGLIVIDEEHEWTYKEQDRNPRYHAREVALRLSRLVGIPLVMGSATPDVVTYNEAKRGRYNLLQLPYRINLSRDGSKKNPHKLGLARVEVADMREELKSGNSSPFSRVLVTELRRCLNDGEQAILFLNRRGSATLVQCRDCGLVLTCSRCTVSLTYHKDSGLLCHHCNRRPRAQTKCPRCRSPRIKFLGIGTQRVIEELEQVLPGVSVLRWDKDKVEELGGHDHLIEAFASGRSQVLVGTQMIAKGLHVPNVSLVGVILADTGLHIPDFRSGERTFQLICQVAGRAGRGSAPGKVVIQTYSPMNYAIQAASLQDYSQLYQKEIEYRREHGNPPYGRLIHMIYTHIDESVCRSEAARFAQMLRSVAFGQGLVDVSVVGPAPAHPQKLRGRSRWHMILKGREPQTLLENVTIPRGWTTDIDPVTVL